jgi:hypothetical protein
MTVSMSLFDTVSSTCETLDDDGSLLNRRMEEGPMGDYQPLVGGKAP